MFCNLLWVLEVFSVVTCLAVLRHGYGRWQAIVDDKDLRVQELICQELNLPFITLPVPGASQAQDAANIAATETPANQTKETGGGTDLAAEAAQGAPDAPNRTQLYPDSNTLYHFREMQRRQVEFVKKRVLLLEKALNAELQKEAFVSLCFLHILNLSPCLACYIF